MPKGIDPSPGTGHEVSSEQPPRDPVRQHPPEETPGQSRYNKSSGYRHHPSHRDGPPQDKRKQRDNRARDEEYHPKKESVHADYPVDRTGPLMSYKKKDSRKTQKDLDLREDDPVEIDEQPRESREKKAYQWRECVVCLLKCSPTSTVWNCQECRITCHLKCIKDWICKQNNLEKFDSKHMDKGRIFSWTCPHCQNPYKQTMPNYYCFCGKVKNPKPDVYVEPHSCGQKCGRKRGGQCAHPCPMDCHSGACPPCEIVVPNVKCYCGRETADRVCGDQNKRSCGQPCRNTLNCGQHKCEKPCHDGDCAPCPLQVEIECHCGKQTATKRCGEDFSCGEICNRQLNCEVHRCQVICHKGPCADCPLFPSDNEKCFCGQTLEADILGHPRDGCFEEKKPCTKICSKQLACGHKCIKSCHSGDCDCGRTIERKCRCANHTFTVPCHRFLDDLLCTQVCKKKKSCGVHRCELKCCIAFNNSLEHLCMEFCGKMLACGIHPCPRKCHTGKCGDCTIMVNQTLRCACGDKVIPAPIKCGTEPPLCSKKCGKILPCGHSCYYTCHAGECKPCQEIIDKPCSCGKKIIPNSICSMKMFCTNLCKNKLPCGHECKEPCHSDNCLVILEKKKQELRSQGVPINQTGCLHPCGRKREACGHPCDLPCHPETPVCTLDPCKHLVRVTCKCGNRSKFLECGSTDKRVKKELPCEERCLNLQRFKALYEKTAKKVYYPGYLVKFAKYFMPYLRQIESSLSDFLLGNQDRMEIVVEKSNPDKLKALSILIPRHYLLELTIHKCFRNSTLTISKTPDSLIPKMPLTVYFEKVSRGDSDVDPAPFEARIRFFDLSYADSLVELERVLAPHKNDIYIEYDKNNNLKLYIWDKTTLPAITKRLEKSNQGFAHFEAEIYNDKDEDEVLFPDNEAGVKATTVDLADNESEAFTGLILGESPPDMDADENTPETQPQVQQSEPQPESQQEQP